MAEFLLAVQNEATNARWAFEVDVDSDGRGGSVVRNSGNTDLSTPGGDVAFGFVDAAGGRSVNTGGTWADIESVRVFDWAAYGLRTDLRVYARDSGSVWGRPAGLPAGQPAGITAMSPGVEVALFEVSENGVLLPDFRQNPAWRVSVRSLRPSRSTAGRYVTFDRVRAMMSTPHADDDSGYDDSGLLTAAQRLALEAAEACVDDYCSQTFDTAPERPVVRRFWPDDGNLLLTPPYAGLTAVSVNGGPLPADGWRPWIEPSASEAGYGGAAARESGLAGGCSG